MPGEIAFLTTAKDVATTVDAVVSTYRSFRTVRKQELKGIEIKAQAHIKQTYTGEAATLTRANIKEIAETTRFIQEQNLPEHALEMAIDQLRTLNYLLKQNLEDFNRMY